MEIKIQMSKVIVYQCESCDEPSSYDLISNHILPDEGPPEEYSFCFCQKCNQPALFIREDMGDGFENDSYYRLYPRHNRHLGFALPQIVRDSYEEAVKCEASKTWTACVVMVGRTLEAVCKEFIPDTRTIYQGLNEMHTQGIISDEILEWSNELRFLRNIGAHASSTKLTYRDSSEAVDFLQSILEILYELRPKFEAMKTRRDAENG